jgi:hypothetical protein
MINVLWVRRRRYIAGMYRIRDNLRDTVAWQGPMLCIIYHYHYHYHRVSTNAVTIHFLALLPTGRRNPDAFSTRKQHIFYMLRLYIFFRIAIAMYRCAPG